MSEVLTLSAMGKVWSLIRQPTNTPRRPKLAAMTEEEHHREFSEMAVELRKIKRQQLMEKRRVCVDSSTESDDEAMSEPHQYVRLNPTDPPEKVLVVLGKMKKDLVTHGPEILDEFNATGHTNMFVKFLVVSNSQPEIQVELLSMLAHVASGTFEQTRVLVESDAILVLLSLIHQPTNRFVLEHAVWVLGNIAADCHDFRDMIVAAGAVGILTEFVNFMPEVNVRVLKTYAWLFAILCQPKYPALNEDVLQDILLAVSAMVIHYSTGVKVDALKILNYVLDGCDSETIELVIKANLPEGFSLLLGNESRPVLIGCLQALNRYVAAATDQQIESLLKAEILMSFSTLLDHKPDVILEAVRFLASATSTETDVAAKKAIIEARILPAVIRLLGSAVIGFEVQKEAAWVVINLADYSDQRIAQLLVREGAIQPICRLLNCKDLEVVAGLLDTLDKILCNTSDPEELKAIYEMVEDCGGMQTLGKLEQHKEQSISNVASFVIGYFNKPKTRRKEKLVDLTWPMLGCEEMDVEF